MPVECPISFRRVPDFEFGEIDRQVMACAYTAQNELGRLCEERVYENEIAARLKADDLIDVQTQVPIVVSFEGFTKTYRLDMVAGGLVYELKVANNFTPAHDAQIYNYAALLDLDRIKLINLGMPQVEGRLRRCPFARIDRHKITVNRSRWNILSSSCEKLASTSESILRDWGGFIDDRLMEEALVHFCGGESTCAKRMPVARNGTTLGHHRLLLHSPDVAFSVTAMGRDASAHERQIRRLLNLLPLRGWQWMNAHHTELRLTTIER